MHEEAIETFENDPAAQTEHSMARGAEENVPSQHCRQMPNPDA